MYFKKADREFKDKIMSQVRKKKLPFDFNDWLTNCPFKNRVYMFFRIEGCGKKKKYYGACQHCKHENIELKNVKHGHESCCPVCHKKVCYRNEKFSQCFNDVEYVSIVQKIKDGYILRNFQVSKRSEYLSFKYHLYEMERVFFTFDDDSVSDLKWFRFYDLHWTFGEYKNMSWVYPGMTWLYYKNLGMFLKGNYRYSGLKLFAKNHEVYIFDYLKFYSNFYQMEYLVKVRMYNLVSDILNRYCCDSDFSYCQKDLKKFLMLDGEYYKYALVNNVNFNGIKALRVLKFLNLSVDTKSFLFACCFVSLHLDCDFVAYVLDKVGCKSLIRYFASHLKTKDNLRDYFDYLDLCLKLKRDLNNTMYLKPENFRVAHDQAVLLYESKKNEKLDKVVNKILQKYKCLAFEKGEYAVVMPVIADDIRLEGKNMKNCVAGYVARVKQGSSIICFVRHSAEKDKSFYTLELNPKDLKVVQCRGYHNETTPEESKVKKFVNYWHKNVVLKRLAVV